MFSVFEIEEKIVFCKNQFDFSLIFLLNFLAIIMQILNRFANIVFTEFFYKKSSLRRNIQANQMVRRTVSYWESSSDFTCILLIKG